MKKSIKRELIGNEGMVLLDTVRRLHRRKAVDHLLKLLKKTHPADIAWIFRHLTAEERRSIFNIIAQTDLVGDFLSELDESIMVELVSSLTPQYLVTIIKEMDKDDVADLLEALPEELANEIRKLMEKTDREEVDELLQYDPDTAGGHLGEKIENIGSGAYDQYATVRAVKAYFRDEHDLDIPIIAAGGIWDRQDVEHALREGADGVQMASRFVCTEECDAEPAFKQAYLDCRKEDIGLIMSPAGLPGRAIKKNVEQVREHDLGIDLHCPSACLKKCAYQEGRERFCIVHALDRAQRGDVDTGLVFCGTNAWKADHITTVQAIFEELFDLADGVPINQAANG